MSLYIHNNKITAQYINAKSDLNVPVLPPQSNVLNFHPIEEKPQP